MRQSVLVTGAAGFAGGHLLDLLTGANGDARAGSVDVVGWYRPGRMPTERPGVRWAGVDLLDRDAVADAIALVRPSVVYHCAGAAHVGRAWEQTEATFAVNVRGSHHVLDGLARAGVSARVLIPGSAHVYRPAGEPLTESHPLVPASPYGLSKLAQELLAGHDYGGGITVAVARAFNHFGPRQDPSFSTSGFARQIAAIEAGRQPPTIVVGNLDARRDLTDVRDVVRAYEVVAERGAAARPYNVCRGSAIAIGEVLEMLVGRARVRITVQVDPARFRPNDFPLLLGDASRIRDELGWTPKMPLSQTLDDVLAYWRGEQRQAMMGE